MNQPQEPAPARPTSAAVSTRAEEHRRCTSDPAATRVTELPTRFSMLRHPGATCLAEVLRFHAERTPDAVAIAAPARPPLTYGGLLTQTRNTARALDDLGVGPNDRVAIALPNGPELAAAFLAVSCGAACAPLNPDAGGPELLSALSSLGPRRLIVASGTAAPLREAADVLGIPVLDLSPVSGGPAGSFALDTGRGSGAATPVFSGPDDLALLLSTSGTTSRPRLAQLSHHNMLSGCANIAASLELTTTDRCLNMAPLYHGAGLLAAIVSSIVAGASVVCCPGFDAGRFFDWIDEFRPTWYGAVPTVHRAIVAAAVKAPERAAKTSLRFIRSGSAPLPPPVRADLERLFGVPVVESYALSEAVQLASTSLRPEARKPGSLGIPAGIEVAVVDDSGALLGPGDTGEIVCRGPSVMRGYHDDPAASERVFVNGWLRTGDQGFLDSEGHLFVTVRLKEVINRGGAKVSPQEVDGVLLEHPAIAHAATFALPDDKLGESVAAAVVFRPGASASASQIRAFAASRLSAFKVPGRIIIVPEIPVGPTGKVQRLALAQQLGLVGPDRTRLPGTTGKRFLAPRDILEAQLVRMWEDLFDIRPIDIADDFFDLGGHSLLAALLMEEIEKSSGRRLHPSILLEAPTVERLALAIQADAARQPLLQIRRGHRLPFIFLNGDLNGGGFYCVKLAESLEAGQPFYALSSHGIGGDPAPSSIEAAAASHLETVRAAQPGGPYLLGGFSHGGLVAFEMARQLEASGEKVALLFIVDTAADPRLRRRRSGPLRRAIIRWQNRFRRLRADMSDLGPRGQLGLALGKVGRYLARRASPISAQNLDGTEMTRQAQRLFDAYRRLSNGYVPKPYGGRVTLVSSAEGAAPSDPTLGWSRVAPEVRVLSVPGTHLTCITQHVGVLGQHLRRSLQEAVW